MKTKWLLYLFICSMQIVSYSQVNVRDTIDDETTIIYHTNFENDYSFIHIDSATAHLWEVGKPHKWFCESAFSGENVLATGLTNGLPPHSETSITFKFERCLNCWYCNCIEDSGILFLYTCAFNDSSGVIVEVSYDKGHNWHNYFTDTSFGGGHGTFPIDTILFPNGEWGFSAIKSSWLPELWIGKGFPNTYNGAGAVTSVYFKWRIVNYSTQTVGGIMIDDIQFINSTWCEFLKIDEHQKYDDGINIFPNPIEQEFYIDLSLINEEPLSVQIYNTEGKTCYAKQNPGYPRIKIPELRLLPGQYFVLLNFKNNKTKIKKIIIINESK